MRVQTFLVIDGFASCTHSFPLLEKNGEKRTLREGYAPSLRTLPQVETFWSCKNRKEQAPAEATAAHQFLANPWMSLLRFKSSKKDFGGMLRLKDSRWNWKIFGEDVGECRSYGFSPEF